MAVRDDFAAGEVLAAADLNDTFAEKLPYSYGTATPSTSVDGFLWYDENDTPPAPKFWDGSAFIDFPNGLTLISSNTITAASGVSVNSCFSGTYENYLLVVLISAASTNSQVFFRLRASGSDATGANYAYSNRYLRLDAAGSGTGTGSSATSMQLAATQNSSNGCSAVINILGPNKTEFTKMSGFAVNQQNSADIYLYDHGCMHTLATAYDGCTVAADTGNITGTVRIYGYKG